MLGHLGDHLGLSEALVGPSGAHKDPLTHRCPRRPEAGRGGTPPRAGRGWQTKHARPPPPRGLVGFVLDPSSDIWTLVLNLSFDAGTAARRGVGLARAASAGGGKDGDGQGDVLQGGDDQRQRVPPAEEDRRGRVRGEDQAAYHGAGVGRAMFLPVRLIDYCHPTSSLASRPPDATLPVCPILTHRPLPALASTMPTPTLARLDSAGSTYWCFRVFCLMYDAPATDQHACSMRTSSQTNEPSNRVDVARRNGICRPSLGR
eukprot:8075443-Pyramimonas_sp.AAC.1